MKAVILNFPLRTFFHNVFEEVKKKQNDIQLRKINFLYKEAYKYFLEMYLIKSENENRIDFPAFAYESGMVICQKILNLVAPSIIAASSNSLGIVSKKPLQI